GSFRRAYRIVIHPENEGSNGVNISLGEAIEHRGIFLRLVEAFVYVFQIRGIDRFHADKDPLAARGGDQVDEFLIAQQVGADLRHPVQLRAGGDNIPQQRLGALEVDGEIIVDEEHGNLAALLASPRLQQQKFIDDALVGAKTDGVAEKSGHGAELAAIRTAASRLHRDDAEGSPTLAMFLQPAFRRFRHEVELLKIDRIPGN